MLQMPGRSEESGMTVLTGSVTPGWGARIVRRWRGETPAAKADAYTAYLERTGVRDTRATPGNRGVMVLRRVVGDRASFEFLSFWESRDAIAAFAGDDIERARYYPKDDAFLLGRELTVDHFELVVER
jgi:heme-degrading monooxygenase HmoA